MSNSQNANPEAPERLLKRDLFGEVWLNAAAATPYIERRLTGTPWVTRPIARWLAAREARALARAASIEQTPHLLAYDSQSLRRSFIAGSPMQEADNLTPTYFRDALRLVRRLHRLGIAHNDLAKEPNWLVTDDARPALVDFQLASIKPGRGRWFRTMAREDLRHLYKHKRTYFPDHLTARQHALLARKAWPSRLWMRTGKPVYLFVTRRLIGWADREGAGDRSL